MEVKLIRSKAILETPIEIISKASAEIEWVARVSRQSTVTARGKLLKHLIDSGHHSALEFGPNITVRFICSRAIANEIVRHRLASFMQESTRYVDYSKSISFVIPRELKFDGSIGYLTKSIGKNYGVNICYESSLVGSPSTPITVLSSWLESVLTAYKFYREFLSTGIKKQTARDLLPMCLKTELVMSSNIREWRHVLELRTAPSAHPEMRELMMEVLRALVCISPEVFGDIREKRSN